MTSQSKDSDIGATALCQVKGCANERLLFESYCVTHIKQHGSNVPLEVYEKAFGNPVAQSKDEGAKQTDYEIAYCSNCNQMTNHLEEVCQKCRASTESLRKQIKSLLWGWYCQREKLPYLNTVEGVAKWGIESTKLDAFYADKFEALISQWGYEQRIDELEEAINVMLTAHNWQEAIHETYHRIESLQKEQSKESK